MTPPARILLASDGSEQSAAAARYVSLVLSKKSEIVLFHVVPETPEAFRDLAEDPPTYATDVPLRAWVDHQKKKIAEFMGTMHMKVSPRDAEALPRLKNFNSVEPAASCFTWPMTRHCGS